METIRLVRAPGLQSPGTLGKVTLPSGKTLLSGELPWRDNRRAQSCIPPGTYECIWRASPKFGWAYEVTDVPERSHILIHPANFIGLASEGFKQELNGCIALGLGIGLYEKQRILVSSRLAVAQFARELDRQSFKLEIS